MIWWGRTVTFPAFVSLQNRDATLQYVLLGSTLDELLMAATMLLTRHGFEVGMAGEPGRWESRAEFCRRIGISASHFKRRMRRRAHAPEVEEERGPTGRLVRLRSNERFDDWMRRRG